MQDDTLLAVSWCPSAFGRGARAARVRWDALAARLTTHRPVPRPLSPWCPACRVRMTRWTPCPRCGGAMEPCKLELPAWSPIAWPGGVRSIGQATAVSALVLDYDGKLPLDVVEGRWKDVGHVGYTTWSHADAAQARARVVVPLSAPVPAASWSTVWAWACARDDQHDTKCGDLARLHFLPFEREGRAHHTWRHVGPPLDVAQVLRDASPGPSATRAPVGASSRRRDDRLKSDPDVRRTAMVAAGGVVAGEGAGERVRHIPCPACGRPSVWGYVQPRVWSGVGCEHKASCGWTGWVDELVTP